MWLRWMLIAFVANGLGPFGLKMLAEAGLAERFHYQYLVFWYAGGLVLALGAWMGKRVRPVAAELWIAAVMALGSFFGQLFTSIALERGVPGTWSFRSPPAATCSWSPRRACCCSTKRSGPMAWRAS